MVRVVYIAGADRSGSTMLSRVLGSYPGCVAVGELYDFWYQSIQGFALCSCGAPFLECDFWNAVMHEAFGGWDEVDAERIQALRGSVQSIRHTAWIHFPKLRTSAYNMRLQEYVSILERLYLAIQKVSGCDVIVDSSKIAAYAMAIAESPTIDVRLVHMVRDSRASAFSWRRMKREASVSDQVLYQSQQPLVRVALVWAMRNSLVRWAAHRFDDALTLRYEDLTRCPREAVTRLVNDLDIEQSIDWISDSEMAPSTTNHIFFGNPNRIERNRIQIRPDDEWRTRMSWAHKGLVTALTLPTLWQLGYLSFRHGR